MDTEATIRQYLPQILHLSLATCANGKPWVCEVHFAYDDGLNLYFISLPSRRHSQEIVANPSVAGDIVTQHVAGQKLLGVYFEGTAKKVDPVDDEHPAFRAYDDRYHNGSWLSGELQKDGGHRLYQINVTDFYTFDSRTGPGQKRHLPWPHRSR